MNKFNLLSLTTCSVAALVSCSTPSVSTTREIAPNAPADTPSSYHLPPFEEKILPNGLRLLFVADDKLPYISYSMMIRAGTAEDPAEQAGLAEVVAELLDKGTAKRSATQIAQDLGNMGADLETSAGYDYTTVSASGLSTQADALLDNFAEVVLQPAFSDGEIDRVKKQFVAQIERRVDNPEAYADVAFAKMVYGDHPYGRPENGTVASMDAIKKKNIIQEYLRFYRPNNTIMAVVGKYTPELKAKVEQVFGAWQKRDIPEMKFPSIEQVQGLHIRLLDKPDLVQAQIRFGYPGIKRQNEDFLALRVANTILGGAFASRLNDRIRKQLGLTYNISSYFDARQDVGPFEIETFTKTESIGQTVSETLKVVNEFHDKGATKEEVERTKGYLKGVFPAAIETSEKLAFNLMVLRFYEIPDTYLTNYLRDIDRLTVSDINHAIEKYINAKNIQVLVYGNAEAAKGQLAPLAVDAHVLDVRKATSD